MKPANFFQKNNFPPLLHLSFILQQVTDELLLDKVGIGLSQIRIMSVLHQSVPRTQRFVAISLGQTEANVSRLLRQMQKQGLVKIARSKIDRRQKDVTLTNVGHKAYQKANVLLSKQQSQLMRLLTKNEMKVFEQVTHNLIQQLR
jgi:DNA-binding MarR family transcriptional regulator